MIIFNYYYDNLIYFEYFPIKEELIEINLFKYKLINFLFSISKIKLNDKFFKLLNKII